MSGARATSRRWRFGDVGAVVCHKRNYNKVRDAFARAIEVSRNMGKKAGVKGFINRSANPWKTEDGERMVIHLTPEGAAAMEGIEGYALTDDIRGVLPLVEWVPGMRHPKMTGHVPAVEVPDNAAFTFTDLFAGIGGFRVGCEAAGGHCVYSVEVEPYCRRAYTRNFGHEPQGRDIMQVEAAAIPQHTVLTGGFPCGPFTLAAQHLRKGFDDPRGLLYLHIARLLEGVQPDLFLLENVPGVRKDANCNVIIAALEAVGYDVSFFLADAVNLVPQFRNRAFFVGIRNDIAAQLQQPYAPPPLPHFNRTPREVLEDLHPAERQKHLIPLPLLRRILYSNTSRILSPGSRHLAPDEPCATLQACYKRNPTGFTQVVEADRFLTERECARMQGFPDSFLVDHERAHHQLGNSVSPPLVAILASHLVAHVRHHRTTADESTIPLWLPGWSAAAKLALQSSADPAALCARPVSLPHAGIDTTIGGLAAMSPPAAERAVAPQQPAMSARAA